jgi:DNA-binding CsgD family transcriptional regulator
MTTAPPRPVVVVVSHDPVTVAADMFADRRIVTGELPGQPFDLAGEPLVWVTTVNGPDELEPVLFGITRGVDAVICARLDPGPARELVDDLRRIATVRLPGEPGPTPDLTAEHAALLGAIAAGCSLEEAAARASVSRRTAARRLAQARATLGVHTTVEAARLAAELGLLKA